MWQAETTNNVLSHPHVSWCIFEAKHKLNIKNIKIRGAFCFVSKTNIHKKSDGVGRDDKLCGMNGNEDNVMTWLPRGLAHSPPHS